MIPRTLLFGNPERSHARISPDGGQLAWLAPLDGVLNIWVAPAGDPDAARPVTRDAHRGVRSFHWAYTSRHIVYPQDRDGDENWHIHSVELETGTDTDLTPIEGVAARIQAVSPKFPEEIVVGINDRGERQLHDVYRVHLLTGERTLMLENPGFVTFLIDDDYRPRLAIAFTPEAGHVYLQPDTRAGWKESARVDPSDAMTTHPVGFDRLAEHYYLLDSRGRDKSALHLVSLETGEGRLLAESETADIDGVVLHPTGKNLQAVTFTDARQEWRVVDPGFQEDLDYLSGVADGELQITSRTLDDRLWTVAYVMDRGPVSFYLYDRPARAARFLFSSRSDMEGLPLVRMHPETIRARDGLRLVGYLSLPHDSDPRGSGRPGAPLPMVLLVHGGPWARDDWGYNPQHQWLADRGYAVLSVNYRGSTGFGKEFINKANRQWAGTMHDDLIDAVEWALDQGIAIRERVAIMGGSYGGYATLVGLTFTPEVFRCGVDIVGPSNLLTLMDNPPPYWMPLMSLMKVRTGDFTTEEGREFLKSRSPLFRVERIVRPLLIAQGKHDPRVRQAESDQIVRAMDERGIPVSYMLFTEEGHGFAKPENRLAFFAVAEAFLAAHLGGAFEPIGDAFTGAVFTCPAGVDGVPGLEEALGRVGVPVRED